MHTSDIYHTQGIKGFQVKSTNYTGGKVRVSLVHSSDRRLSCAACNSHDVSPKRIGTRDIIGERVGNKQLVFTVERLRIDCAACGANLLEVLPFTEKWARHTKSLDRTVIELRRHMSIKAVADWTGLDWRTVKQIEMRHLSVKFRHIRLRNVRIIGIDEIYVGKDHYMTIVRDLESGAVLFVGDGKGGDALKSFERRILKVKRRIEAVAMDMSSGYAAWAKKVLPKAQIVFDHFHLVKLMNDKLNDIRRRTMASLDDETRKTLKGKRSLFQRNEEDLTPDEAQALSSLKEMSADLGVAHGLKEKLRSIYRNATTAEEARPLFIEWIGIAKATGIGPLKTIANTVERHIEGILGYWHFDELTSAGMEGFNNKIRWLIHQAYGYHDDYYFTLKIYDLPNCSTTKAI